MKINKYKSITNNLNKNKVNKIRFLTRIINSSSKYKFILERDSLKARITQFVYIIFVWD